MKTWKDLLVTRTQGSDSERAACQSYPLPALMTEHPEWLEDVEPGEAGDIFQWLEFCIHVAGEASDSDTPREEIDWTGFWHAYVDATCAYEAEQIAKEHPLCVGCGQSVYDNRPFFEVGNDELLCGKCHAESRPLAAV